MGKGWETFAKPDEAGAWCSAEIETERLVIRAPAWSDLRTIVGVMRREEVAMCLSAPPWPYPDESAEEWVGLARKARRDGESMTCILCLKGDREVVVGACELSVDWVHRCGEMGYWIAMERWGHGFATEAAHAVVDHGFGVMGLHRIEALAFGSNDASMRVLEKCGLRREGVRRERFYRGGRYHDAVVFGVLKQDWLEEKEL